MDNKQKKTKKSAKVTKVTKDIIEEQKKEQHVEQHIEQPSKQEVINVVNQTEKEQFLEKLDLILINLSTINLFIYEKLREFSTWEFSDSRE
jgi:hypothetical protein